MKFVGLISNVDRAFFKSRIRNLLAKSIGQSASISSENKAHRGTTTMLEPSSEMLEEYVENTSWIRRRYKKLASQFEGEYVAVSNGMVLEHDRDPKLLYERLGRNHQKSEYAAIEFISEKKIIYSD